MRALHALSVALVFGLLGAAPVVAQEPSTNDDARVLTSAAMDVALAGHESEVTRQRDDLDALLSNPRVRDLALGHGIDIRRVESAAAGLTDEQMQELAPLVTDAHPLMRDGLGTVTISVVGIIIVLLLLILVT